MRPVTLGLVGLGAWGARLAAAVAEVPALRLVGAADVDPARLLALPDGVARAASLEALLERAQPEAVLVATPPPTHFELAARALGAGCHALVEKPLCFHADEAVRLCALAATHGRVLSSGHLLLFHPAVEALRALVQGGALGEVRCVLAERTGTARHRDVGAWWTLAPHDLSLVARVLGAELGAPTVRAEGGDAAPHGSTARLSVGGATVGLRSALGPRVPRRRSFWWGTAGAALLDELGPAGLTRFEATGAAPDVAAFARDPDAELGRVLGGRRGSFLPTPGPRPLQASLGAFAAAARGAPTPADAAEGLRVVTALEAGQRSLSALRASAPGARGMLRPP